MIDYEKLEQAFKRLAEALEPIIKVFIEKWNQFKSLVWRYDEYLKKEKKINHLRETWIVPADTRIKSQVLINKPRNLVKKVIR